MTEADVSIIVLNHDKAAYSRACLESLLRTQHSSPFEVIAVDNGSQDATPEVLAEMQVRYARAGRALRILTNPTNAGAATGRNQAMQIATGRYLAFVDNDVIVKDRKWLSRLQAKLQDDPSIGIISPKLIFPWEPFLIECAGCAVSRTGRIQYVGRGFARDDPRFNTEREAQCLISACILFPHLVVDAIGMLDEAFNPVQYEDIDFCYRARSKGYRVVYMPRVEMYHFENTTTEGSTDINFRYVTIKNGMLFKKRWRHMFEKEAGPPDEDCAWQSLPKKTIEQVCVSDLLCCEEEVN